MAHTGEIVLIYTGGEVIIRRLEAELQQQGIQSIIKDGFKQGLAAGFGEGVPSAIDLYVAAEQAEQAQEIVKAIVED
ncbi:MAG: DUF2007 domain-containing protein [Prolixibacteraceae bacterium]|nr:DUF2007 domain-containing protein [Prolixibacteraceae bacterium]